MNNEIFFSIVFLFGVLTACFSQILLKKSANKNGSSGRKAYLNMYVIASYSLFIFSTLLSLFCLKYIPLSQAPVLDATSYIFIAILSRVFFSEKITIKKAIGFVLIIIGIAVFSI